MLDFLVQLFDTAGFPARWHCGTWTPAHGWLHIGSDVAIFLAYVTIPALLGYLVRRRKDLPFPGTFWLFCAFIFTCGATHLVEATLFWTPWYRLSGVLKLATAVASWLTVFALAPAARSALDLPGLAVLNRLLKEEVELRRAAEEALAAQADRLRNDVTELEAFTTAIGGREQRVLELKGEVNALLSELGRQPRYGVTEDPS